MANRTGASSPNWKGGVTPERQRLYSTLEWKRVARLVRKRDGGCVECGAAVDTHIHHVKPFALYPELRLDPDNLLTLCPRHHYEAHRKGVAA
jgi:5-methylcytosine-specific restriction protein A